MLEEDERDQREQEEVVEEADASAEQHAGDDHHQVHGQEHEDLGCGVSPSRARDERAHEGDDCTDVGQHRLAK